VSSNKALISGCISGLLVSGCILSGRGAVRSGDVGGFLLRLYIYIYIYREIKMFHSKYVLSNGSNTKNTFNQSLNTTDDVVFNNLTVNGTSTTISSVNLSVADSLIVCGSGNLADTLDLGLLCEYTNSITNTTNWAGLIRDGASKSFYLVENLMTQTDPVSLSDLAKINVSDIVSVTGSFSGSINNIDDRFRIGHNTSNWASMDTVSRLYLNVDRCSGKCKNRIICRG